jgi:hypothetical protein
MTFEKIKRWNEAMGDEMGQLNDLVRGVFYGTSM